MIDFIDTDLRRVILWQYEGAPKLKALISSQNDWHKKNHKEFYERLHKDFFCLDTANRWGLLLWARIFKVPISKQFKPHNKRAFGFGRNRANFNNGNFGARDGFKINLTDDMLRMLIKMRYFKLTNQPTLYNINKFFDEIGFKMYVVDPMDMTHAYYVLTENPNYDLKFLIDEMDFLPRPCGVDIRYVIISKKSFGFGKHRANFNNGNFGTVGIKDE